MPKKMGMSGMGAMPASSNSNVRKARSAYWNGSTQPRPKRGTARGNIPPGMQSA